ncbi:MAG: hypothetical protein COB66_07935 [Coxiella sp. (in: Bacteria)]|nr:MAG: hypothetical protein COB66_07935 [Coxiella sp. (in: g-proteobacteria)]
MLGKVETIRQVLVSAIESGIPGAQAALKDLTDVNAGMIELNGMRSEVIQAAIDEQEAEEIANGVIAHG